jgi:hypothetical protein
MDVRRIVTRVTITNLLDEERTIQCDAPIDTGASCLTLPSAWRERLGNPPVLRRVEAETATQDVVEGDVCGPLRIQIEGFPPVAGEALFLDMNPRDGRYEPLIGTVVLEQSQAAVDMIGHRLIHTRRADLKAANFSSRDSMGPETP